MFQHRRPSVARAVVFVAAFAAVCLPALIHGEILYLKDGSSIRGTVVAIAGDTLTFDTSFGSRIKIARAKIARIVWSENGKDSQGSVVPPVRGGQQPAGGEGYLSIVFKDNKVSSKVAIHMKKDEAAVARANWIVQTLIALGDTAFSAIDSVTDKTVYKGHDKILKNTAELQDMKIRVPAGMHHFVVSVRNRGMKGADEDELFDDGPLDMTLELENVQIFPDRTTRIYLGINKGRLRLGRPRLYRVTD
jgi:hypothetical protein